VIYPDEVVDGGAVDNARADRLHGTWELGLKVLGNEAVVDMLSCHRSLGLIV